MRERFQRFFNRFLDCLYPKEPIKKKETSSESFKEVCDEFMRLLKIRDAQIIEMKKKGIIK